MGIQKKELVVTELQGDGIAPELEKTIAMVADALPLRIKFEKVDWSIGSREESGRLAIEEGLKSIEKNRLAIKYPTETRNESPNAILRRHCKFSVIYRPVFSIPGITSNFNKPINLHIVRVATGGTYEDPGKLIGNEAAVSLRLVEREPCTHAATFAFELARRNGWCLTSASKHTIQRVTDGLFESVVVDVHKQYTDVSHRKELFDALLGQLVMTPEKYQVVLVLNEYGDFLSDLASGMAGSIGTGASGTYAFDQNHQVSMAMFDPAGGTAPDIAGKDLCNPSAILLAFSMLLEHVAEFELSNSLRRSVLSSIKEGNCTRDLGGNLGCQDFTKLIVEKMKI